MRPNDDGHFVFSTQALLSSDQWTVGVGFWLDPQYIFSASTPLIGFGNSYTLNARNATGTYIFDLISSAGVLVTTLSITDLSANAGLIHLNVGLTKTDADNGSGYIQANGETISAGAIADTLLAQDLIVGGGYGRYVGTELIPRITAGYKAYMHDLRVMCRADDTIISDAEYFEDYTLNRGENIIPGVNVWPI
jgi:hypothetical protein